MPNVSTNRANIATSQVLVTTGKSILTHTIEVSTLGFISNITDFTKAINISALPVDLKQSIIRSVTSSSFNIYCNRNKAADVATTL